MERTQRRARPALLTALALAAPVTLAAVPANAAPDTYVYDALGDSYAAGYGVSPEYAHPNLLDGRMRIDLDDFAAVPGAQTADITDQLGALTPDTELVTLSIGGNDVAWSTAVTACLGGTDQQCAEAVAYSTWLITTSLPTLLDAVYTGVDAAAPDAHVVVTGYPRLFSPEYGSFYLASVAEQEAMNAAADLLNGIIAAEAAEAGFQFVDVSGRFDGHGVNAPEPWIDPATFHPSVEGHIAYAAALTSQISPRSLR